MNVLGGWDNRRIPGWLLVGVLCWLPAGAWAQTTALNQPGMYARGGAIFLDRSSPPSQLFARSADSDTTFNASDFHFETSAGWDVLLGMNVTETWGIDTRIFRVDGIDAAASIVQPGTGFFPGLGIVTAGDQLNGIFSAGMVPTVGNFTFHSELTSVEVNARAYPLGENVALIAGFRYISLQDRVTASFVKDGFTNAFGLNADNDLYGGQFGAEARLLNWNWFTLDFLGKAGVYGNRASAEINNQSDVFVRNSITSANEGETSFVGELGLNAGFQLTQNVILRAGYQLLWLDAIAVGTSQASVNSDAFPDGPLVATDVHTRGEAFYHGALISIEVRR